MDPSQKHTDHLSTSPVMGWLPEALGQGCRRLECRGVRKKRGQGVKDNSSGRWVALVRGKRHRCDLGHREASRDADRPAHWEATETLGEVVSRGGCLEATTSGTTYRRTKREATDSKRQAESIKLASPHAAVPRRGCPRAHGE